MTTQLAFLWITPLDFVKPDQQIDLIAVHRSVDRAPNLDLST